MATAKEIGTLIDILLLLKADYKDMTVAQVVTFLLYSENTDLYHSTIAKKLGVSGPTISRIQDKLADGKPKTKDVGLRYLKITRGGQLDDRRNTIILTPKGQKLIEQIKHLMRLQRHDNPA